MLIEIKHRYTGKVIFSHDCENNTFAKTVELAVKNKVSLANANMRGADLRNAIMYKADLSYAIMYKADMRNADMRNANMYKAVMSNANMIGADMSYTDMRNADMRNANMYKAVMSNADMCYADITGACLYNTIGNGKEVITLQTEFYTVNFVKGRIQIDCKNFSNKEWFSFTDDQVSALDNDNEKALKFWRKYKSILKQMAL